MTVLALVPAAGDGVRLGAGMPKALVRLGGVPLVVRAVRGLLASGAVDVVVVTAHPEHVDAVVELFAGSERPPDVLAGGVDRTASVRMALEHGLAAHPGAHTVLVHDAARALTPPTLTAALVKAVAAGASAVVPVLPLADTVKRVGLDRYGAGVVLATADRAELRAVQTPQAFAAGLLRRAYAAAGSDTPATDDAGLVERLGEKVLTVPGDPLAFKITTAWDLRLAELLVGDR